MSDKLSQHSGSTRASRSSAAVIARARAKAAKVRAAFAEKEVAMKVDKAKLEANLEALSLEKEAAAAVAEAEALEAAEIANEESSEPRISQDDYSGIGKALSEERTRDYVNTLPVPTLNPEPVSAAANHHVTAPASHIGSDHQSQAAGYTFSSSPPQQPQISSQNPYSRLQTQNPSPSKPININREQPHYKPQRNIQRGTPEYPYSPYIPAPPRPPDDMLNMARYLARREIISTGLKQFDDSPETYRAWRSSFLNAINDLNLSASEELDLLTKWLGKESSNYVRRLRSVHIGNPHAALQMVWARLNEVYCSPEAIEQALLTKLDNFPKISSRDYHKLRELGDLLMELLSAKEDGYLPGLTVLDTARGINPIVEKLPFRLQEKWIYQGSKFKAAHNVTYPPFSFFTEFVCLNAKIRNDPCFVQFSTSSHKQERPTAKVKGKMAVTVHKTDVKPTTDHEADNSQKNDVAKQCPIHNKPHPLKKCRGFRLKTLEERKAYLKEQGICFKCCASDSHLAKQCKAVLKCGECDSENHVSAMHPGPPPWSVKNAELAINDGGEGEESRQLTAVNTHCMEVCGEGQAGRSCAKICLVKVYPQGKPEMAARMYAMLDDQSNRSLARSDFFNLFSIIDTEAPYSLKTCAGVVETCGRRADGFCIEPVSGGDSFSLPTLIECNDIPDNRAEIPTPEVALQHPHLRSIASQIPHLDPDAHILLLLGRDVLRAHKVRQHINGPNDAPFAQRLDLGWVLVGEMCLGNAHKPKVYSAKTNVLENGRPSLLTPCSSHIQIKELSHTLTGKAKEKTIGSLVFQKTKEDNKLALSIEDERFLQIMDKHMYKDGANSWVAPLPFRHPRPCLPLSCLSSLCRTLERKPSMKEQFIGFMQKILNNDHAEVAPQLKDNQECWYLPSFGVYHPKKPDQIRIVFDSSAQHLGVSLNDVLLTGPDLNNSLLGVLIRFRKELIAITADIQQMFHCFVVKPDHRDYLRFLWHRDNDPTKDIIEYRMKVHVFGNRPSPAVATYGLRRAAQECEKEYGNAARRFIERNFYVDDGLISLPTEAEAIHLLQTTQALLSESNLRLHKIASNSINVLKAFPKEDHAENMKDLDLEGDTPHTQRSLGLTWEITTDTFSFQVSDNDKPYTRRGVLSTVNSLYDPLGFAAPVTIYGRLLLRELSVDSIEWDSPLPENKRMEWETWRHSLKALEELHVPRTYTTQSLSKARRKEICIFSDASTKAIGAVAYLKTVSEDGVCQLGFILGKAKLAPQVDLTIPRLELCAAVLAVEIAEFIVDEIDFEPDAIHFFCDSKVVLGYICNETKRFYVYVHNRVQRIRQSTSPKQWHYVSTEHNPADFASRAVSASQLASTFWLTGPAFLCKQHDVSTTRPDLFQLIDPGHDAEIRPERFERFSRWTVLLKAVASLIHVARSFKSAYAGKDVKCKGWHHCGQHPTAEELLQASKIIIQSVQRTAFPEEIKSLSHSSTVFKNSSISKLNPILDEEGMLRVGGRLANAEVGDEEKRPLILPGGHHISLLLIRHHHDRVRHQGRLFTEGAIRAAGLWLVGGKRCISKVLHKCITCRKLRGNAEKQKMADLPKERLCVAPPFTHVGLDVFGPWNVTARRTRGGMAQSKRWALLFTCMSTRAVHIEVIESMDSSSCINAIRRFFAIRGPAKTLHSDCGTNFIGASKELGFGEPSVQGYISQEGCTWHFNPPHASHMGGVWERMIGVARKILDSMLMQTKVVLSHEVLCTLMAEVSAIMNARPLVPIQTDPDLPFLLTPSTLLTQKGVSLAPPGDFTEKDLYKRQWMQVQSMANRFWSRWRAEYLQSLQPRRKWQDEQRNIGVGDLVLLRDAQAVRNEWPMAIITAVFPGQDGKVRKVELKVAKEGATKKFLRPVSEIVLLMEKED
ncbi:hypothetical protein ACEWY4_014043 [Coilia grayii]|uniref:Integrase catalytic domain-containing protein n=1 Tax=Coilia grayii TaxID=363190 RepID=A0ABD1JR57_9TELE